MFFLFMQHSKNLTNNTGVNGCTNFCTLITITGNCCVDFLVWIELWQVAVLQEESKLFITFSYWEIINFTVVTVNLYITPVLHHPIVDDFPLTAHPRVFSFFYLRIKLPVIFFFTRFFTKCVLNVVLSIRINGHLVALKVIRMKTEEGVPFTAIREGKKNFFQLWNILISCLVSV